MLFQIISTVEMLMPVNRDLYSNEFVEGQHIPAWICGNCGASSLILIKNSFTEHEGSSITVHSEDFFDYDMTQNAFSCFARCANSTCRETTVIAGTSRIEIFAPQSPHDSPQGVYKSVFKPRYFSCAPRIIAISPDLPTLVSQSLQRSFSLFWTDYNSCVSALRTAIEIALDELSINKTKLTKLNKKTGKRNRIRLTLHKRIELLGELHPNAEELLLAAKWTGNYGTHGTDELEANDVFDAYDIVEQALAICFDKSVDRASKLAKRINSARKPISGSR